MPRHFLTVVAAVAICLPGTLLRAAEVANPYDLPRCPDDAASRRPSQPMGSALTPDEPFEVGTGTLHLDKDGNGEFGDGVTVRQGVHQLSADRLTRNATEGRIDVSGKVEYRNPQIVVQGDTGSFIGGDASFEGAKFELPLRPARGAASSLSLSKDGVLKLSDVHYTTCPEGQVDWQISARSVSINTTKSVGTARDARVEFFGVPIIRLPVISFPVGSARKSGLLFPSLGSSSNSGVQLAVPYYFNLTPQQDLTLTPTYYTSRGLDLNAEYRYLLRNGHGQLDGNFLPDDRKSDQTRSRLKLNAVNELWHDWRLSIDAENVSDARYFEDFSQGADGDSIAFLPRRLQLSFRGEHLDAGMILRNFQTLDQDLSQVDRPHTELPRLYALGSWSLPGALPLNYGFNSEAVYFQHSDDVQGWRFDAAPQVGLNFEGAGYFLRPSAALETTQYRLTDTLPGEDRTPNRTLPILSIDGGLQFERESGSRGQRRMTLEPRLMYLYAPYREQNGLPVFDTAEPDLNWVELFRTNRYTGIDRISDANQLSAGVTTRLYSSSNGARFLSTTIGQIFYFRTPRVRLPDEPPPTGNTSDLIAQVELQAFKNWNVSSGLQWDRQESRTEKAELQLRYQPAPRTVVNLGYRYQRDRLEQADFSTAWPVTDHWRVYGRTLYSLRDNKSIEHFAGFEYGSCCWNLRALARDYVSRRSGERDRSFYLQLELKGLSNVGLAADSFLEKAIRGYSTRAPR
ncbi:MAG: LPS assembly protein LptD [Steroidobacteraceae bacterium]